MESAKLSRDAPDLDAVFRTLGHRGARDLAQLVASSGQASSRHVTERLQLPQDVASKRLKALRRARLVQSERVPGQGLVTRLCGDGWGAASDWFERVLSEPPPEREQGESLDDLFALLGDPGRRRLLERLGPRGKEPVGALAAATGLRPDAASSKLGELRAARVVVAERRRREIWCAIHPPVLTIAWDWVYEVYEHRVRPS